VQLTPSRLVIGAAVLAMAAMWGYVLYLAFGPGRADPPDRLDDPTFAVAAEARCAQTRAAIEALPPAFATPEPADRVAVLTEANEELERMLDDLEALAPGGEDGRIVGLWLEDYRIFLEDRRDYADRLRVDPEARLLVSPKDERQITRAIDGFAEDNRMESCETPLDA
jgi:hypothetical protein